MLKVFDSYKKSLGRLKEIMKEAKTPANRDSAIKRFELTYELARKSVQKYLNEKGIVAIAPSDCFKEAFRLGLIKDNLKWLQMIKDRNNAVHTYNESLAKEIYGKINDYIILFEELKNAL